VQSIICSLCTSTATATLCEGEKEERETAACLCSSRVTLVRCAGVQAGLSLATVDASASGCSVAGMAQVRQIIFTNDATSVVQQVQSEGFTSATPMS